jgi:flagellar biosynthesis/type III secretory pathway protein FliH
MDIVIFHRPNTPDFREDVEALQRTLSEWYEYAQKLERELESVKQEAYQQGFDDGLRYSSK